MTNLEKLKLLDAEEFVKETVKLYQHPAKKYIDYTAYLDSEDENILHFVRHHGECKVIESEKVFANISEEKSENQKQAYLLERVKRYGQDYAMVLTEGKVMIVPESNIIK